MGRAVMVKFLLTILICSLPLAGHAAGYWVYVRIEDKPDVATDDFLRGESCRSKKGDIVAVLPRTQQYVPTVKEKKEYAIIQVDGVREADIESWVEPWYVEAGVKDDGRRIMRTASYRKKKVDVDALRLKKGIHPEKLSPKEINRNLTRKTARDLTYYRYTYLKYTLIGKPIRLATNRIVPPAFAENVSTINKSGEDYNTLTLWEDAKDGDLVTNTVQETAHVYDDQGQFADLPVVVSGSSTSSDYYMKISVPSGERHDGTTSGGGASGTGAEIDGLIKLDDPYCVLEWLKIYNDNGSGQNYASTGYGTADGSTVRYVIGYGMPNSYGNSYGFNLDSDMDIYNCAIFGNAEVAFFADSYDQNIYNCYSQSNGGSAFYGGGGTDVIKNCVGVGSGTNFGGNWATGSEYCASEDETADDDGDMSNAIINITPGDEFEDYSNGDVHLVSTSSDLKDGGTSVSGTFTDDFDGDTRSGTWDIGPDEYVSEGGGIVPTQYYYRHLMQGGT